jgi:YHS domain-containing protein
MENKTSPSNVGAVVSVLRAGDEGRIVIEVLAQHDARPVRGIALTPTQDLARGMTVDEASALRAERDGQTFYFCGDHCRQKFLSTPAQGIAERGRSGLMKEP